MNAFLIVFQLQSLCSGRSRSGQKRWLRSAVACDSLSREACLRDLLCYWDWESDTNCKSDCLAVTSWTSDCSVCVCAWAERLFVLIFFTLCHMVWSVKVHVGFDLLRPLPLILILFGIISTVKREWWHALKCLMPYGPKYDDLSFADIMIMHYYFYLYRPIYAANYFIKY